ncbi:unnamed protein product, partial [Sphenostylis stenocarpa]
VQEECVDIKTISNWDLDQQSDWSKWHTGHTVEAHGLILGLLGPSPFFFQSLFT